MYPILRWGINLASVIADFALKCFLKSSSEIVGGRPLIKIREEALIESWLIPALDSDIVANKMPRKSSS